MGMRITTNGIFQGYRKDLANSYFRFSKSMSRVTTQRNFESYAEDVSAASRAFQLRRSHWRAENQITNSNYVISKFETAWSAIDYIVDGTGMEDNLNSIVESFRGLNSPTGSARVTLGESALAKAESIVRLLNTQYGDQFIFAGEDGRNVPFAWQTDEAGNTWLTYRGIDVSTPVPIMSAQELKEHIQVKYSPEQTSLDVEGMNLDDMAQTVGNALHSGGEDFKLTPVPGESSAFTLSWTDPATGEKMTESLSADDVAGALGYTTGSEVDAQGHTITHSYTFAEPGENGNLIMTATTTLEKWEVAFDDALTGQGFQLAALDFGNPDNVYYSQDDAQAALDALIDESYEALFADYKVQFDDIYASYTHEVDEKGDPVGSAYANYEKLLAMSQETTYVDIGIGVEWDKFAEEGKIPDLIPTSAYNSALNGLTFLGFGSEVGEDGELHSNNLVMLMHEMGTMLKSCDTVTGQYPEGWDTEKVSALTRKIERSVNDVTVQHVKLSNDTKYLQTNLAQLTAQRDNLNNQILDIEQIDPADAISEFMYARYSYNAALSVGSSILTNTLLDYLR